MVLLNKYYKHQGYIFTECYFSYEGLFHNSIFKTVNHKKMTLAGFSQPGTHLLSKL